MRREHGRSLVSCAYRWGREGAGVVAGEEEGRISRAGEDEGGSFYLDAPPAVHNRSQHVFLHLASLISQPT